MPETPPRAWGRLLLFPHHTTPTRNTPTCVGKTPYGREGYTPVQKHPHVRGEDLQRLVCAELQLETPPRAWGRRWRVLKPGGTLRNTPTCVGKTISYIACIHSFEKHPHVRGEDSQTSINPRSWQETPPRAWGRPPNGMNGGRFSRNTPTCVGKTGVQDVEFPTQKKHPHVRGEDSALYVRNLRAMETPPRAWGRLSMLFGVSKPHGNNPTCVGKTPHLCRYGDLKRKHPHVRGEDWRRAFLSSSERETPPRAWGRRSPHGSMTTVKRNTPTCVGKTCNGLQPPRIC